MSIQKDTAPANFSPAASQINSKQKSIVPFIIAGLAGLLFLGIAGIAAILLFYPFDKTETAVITNNPKPTATPISKSVNQNDELNEKLTNLEKQIQEQKNQKETSNTSLFRVRHKTN